MFLLVTLYSHYMFQKGTSQHLKVKKLSLREHLFKLPLVTFIIKNNNKNGGNKYEQFWR